MKQILLNIQERLNTQCKFLKFIDFDEGQLDYYNEHPPVAFPCALIDCISSDFEDLGLTTQQGVATIVITLADLKLTNSSAKAPQNQKDKALEIFDFKEEINKALHGWIPFFKGKLIRKSYRKQKRDDGIKVWVITYTLALVNV